MSRYIYTNQVGIGNYGGLAAAWGFGDGKNKAKKHKFKKQHKKQHREEHKRKKQREHQKHREEKQREHKKKQREHEKHYEEKRRERGKHHEEKQREYRSEGSGKKLDKLVEKINQRAAEGKPIPPGMAERISMLPPEAQEALHSRVPFLQTSEEPLPYADDEIAPATTDTVTTAPGTPGALPAPPIVGMRYPGMPMMRRGPMPTFRPRGPVKPPVITPQQARIGTVAAALASAMLLF